MIYDVLMLLFGVVLTLGTAVFVAAEFSYVALDVASVERRANEGDKKAKQVVKALRILSTQLSGAQVGITLTTILLGYTTQVSLLNLFTKMFTSFGLALTLSTTIAVVLSVIFINAFSMLFGELVPKNMALADPLHTAGIVTPVQAVFTKLLHPRIKVLNDTANGVLHAMGTSPT
ncbi:CNNM domain-containing protein, partial [Gleimia europaea]|nr:CNNM domain-containing protein [Gleimia europaea]